MFNTPRACFSIAIWRGGGKRERKGMCRIRCRCLIFVFFGQIGRGEYENIYKSLAVFDTCDLAFAMVRVTLPTAPYTHDETDYFWRQVLPLV